MTPRLFTKILMCACAIVACAGSATATVSFTTATYFPNGARDLRGIVAGDFNGDGIPDLVVVNAATNDFIYLQGNGDGTFLAPISTSMAGATSLLPEAIVAADFNGDGKLDIAISHPYLDSTFGGGGNLLTVHLGDGAGHFSDGIVITTGATPTSLATGDFNGDGIPDLAVGAKDDNAVWIHLGKGDGTFKDPSRYPISSLSFPTQAIDIAAADVNNDGHLDVVAAASRRATTLLGDGSGAFTPLAAVDVGSDFPQIALGDINGDGRIDLVVSSNGFTEVIPNIDILFGTATGAFAFQFGSSFPTGLGITLADFDTDGNLDVAVGHRLPTSASQIISVLTGDGMGNFPAEFDFGSDLNPIPSYRMVAADLNRDGRPDLAVAGGALHGITVLINTSPRGCDDSLNLTYTGGTLNLSFTLKSAQSAIWSTWLAFQNNVVNLWALPVPRVVPAVNFNVPLPGFPMIGNVGVLTTLSDPTFGLVCFDFKAVDTGGIGATPQELKDQIIKNGIVGSLP